ncbi:hypothetical protein PYW07_010218 [Mythimna separata]|uniref:Uncharacterized protein n=1 Tax=Mythimna separata TaxID=271217 RepID=A0AAD7YH13_MYTSE|nr:hypothetical protein PYW07_010218 [Mythimna separata]
MPFRSEPMTPVGLATLLGLYGFADISMRHAWNTTCPRLGLGVDIWLPNGRTAHHCSLSASPLLRWLEIEVGILFPQHWGVRAISSSMRPPPWLDYCFSERRNRLPLHPALDIKGHYST